MKRLAHTIERLRRLGVGIALAFALAPVQARSADIPCPVGVPAPGGPNYLAEVFDLRFCWQPGGGTPTYLVETRTNRGPWIQEAVASDNHLQLRRSLGDVVQVRIAICQSSSCSTPSDASKKTYVWPNYDADGSGKVTVKDFNLLRATFSQPQELRRFQQVFGRFIVNGRYLVKPPA